MARVIERQRRQHQRSKTGCATCRQRHVRCDGRRPKCSNCTRLAYPCHFDPFDPFVLVTESSYKKSRPVLPDATPNHLFVGIPIELDANSRRLFYVFAQKRGSGRAVSSVTGESFVVRRALSQPGYLHATIIIACIDSICFGEPFEKLLVPFLHHRGKAFQLVSQEMQRTMENNEYTIATVMILGALEGTFYHHNWFNLKYFELHLKGLQEMLSLCPRRILKDSPLHSMIRMVTKHIPHEDIRSHLSSLAASHRAIVSGIHYPKRQVWKTFGTSTSRQNNSLCRRISESSESDDMDLPRILNLKEKTQVAFLMSFLYMYVRLPWNALTSYMLNWAIEIFFEVLDKTESAVTEGTFDPGDWLWICLYGASAAASIVVKFKDDDVQKASWTTEFRQKIYRISHILEIENWNAATRVLKHVRWEDNFDGEEEIRRLWEDAMAQKDWESIPMEILPRGRCGTS